MESPINKSQEPTTIDKTNEIIDEVSIEETPNIDERSIKSTSESSIIEDSFADIARSSVPGTPKKKHDDDAQSDSQP
jgi:hypothetical protein